MQFAEFVINTSHFSFKGLLSYLGNANGMVGILALHFHCSSHIIEAWAVIAEGHLRATMS